ncbi:SipW-dependent-type signal peptide-containing protein [Zhihengliuella halotolerans]|uniref:Putative ribosomally synthesized peptide with SipW-like signal peptide n=1 Tax=Zhihengliuella halotolerans TaxID=370736 RepID=A0A4Q8AA70_9MICC|nr:SipW-dependent-type signal peptide-containing protein [Zhihengliuella halotolerans]RZU60854.1 putative ribosomally synthesized peptide with SipW-like signal peptide [Zhihengliuella halotolerans]
MGRHTSLNRPALLRIRAVLAGALVLGVGTTLTLAAWTDSEHAQSDFTASVFGIQGDPGTGYAEHSTSGTAAQLTFGTAASAMSPGSVVHGRLDVRTTAASTVGGTVALSASTPSGATAITNNLTYRVAVVDTATSCAAATYSGTAVPASSVFSPAQATVAAAAGNARRFCFEVRLATGTPNNAQGQSGNITWQVTGTSD